MSSGTVLDQRPTVPDASAVNDLLVLWQHPTTREIIPIGRFGCSDIGFTFTYTRAAASIDGFWPLPGLDDLDRRYESSVIPAVFEQRVMTRRDRPDYSRYIGGLGLDPDRATPWEQIVESGGRRAGDTLQFMPTPRTVGDRAQARFLVNGVRHIPEDPHIVGDRTVQVTAEQQEEALGALSPGAAVLIEAEANNRVDPHAALVTTQGVPVGWVPRAISADVRELMAAGPLPATVHRIAQPGSSPHVRLVLDLDVPAPPGFVFDQKGDWDPLPNN